MGSGARHSTHPCRLNPQGSNQSEFLHPTGRGSSLGRSRSGPRAALPVAAPPVASSPSTITVSVRAVAALGPAHWLPARPQQSTPSRAGWRTGATGSWGSCQIRDLTRCSTTARASTSTSGSPPSSPDDGCGRGGRSSETPVCCQITRRKALTTGAALRHRHDYLPPGVALFQVGDRRRDLGEQVAPVDLGADLAGRDQLREQLQVLGGDVRLYLGDVLAAA
jgi:hypothetical protein